MQLSHMKKYVVTLVKSDSFIVDKVVGTAVIYFDPGMGIFRNARNQAVVFADHAYGGDEKLRMRFFDARRALKMLSMGDYLYITLDGALQRVGNIIVQDELLEATLETADVAAPVHATHMYVWGSQAMAEWGHGKIVVTATSVAEARDKAEQLFMEVVKLKDTSGYWWNFGLAAGERDPEGTDWDRLEELFDEYVEDISSEPYLCSDGFLLVRGSE